MPTPQHASSRRAPPLSAAVRSTAVRGHAVCRRRPTSRPDTWAWPLPTTPRRSRLAVPAERGPRSAWLLSAYSGVVQAANVYASHWLPNKRSLSFYHPLHYLWARRALVTATGLGLVIEFVYPLAPPRMLGRKDSSMPPRSSGSRFTTHPVSPGSPTSSPRCRVCTALLVAIVLVLVDRVPAEVTVALHPNRHLVRRGGHRQPLSALDGLVGSALVVFALARSSLTPLSPRVPSTRRHVRGQGLGQSLSRGALPLNGRDMPQPRDMPQDRYLRIDLGTSGLEASRPGSVPTALPRGVRGGVRRDCTAPRLGGDGTQPRGCGRWSRPRGRIAPQVHELAVAGQCRGTVWSTRPGGRAECGAVAGSPRDRRACDLWRSMPRTQRARLANPLVPG